MFLDSEMFGRAAAMISTTKHRMRFINKHFCIVFLADLNQFFQITEVAIH